MRRLLWIAVAIAIPLAILAAPDAGQPVNISPYAEAADAAAREIEELAEYQVARHGGSISDYVSNEYLMIGHIRDALVEQINGIKSCECDPDATSRSITQLQTAIGSIEYRMPGLSNLVYQADLEYSVGQLTNDLELLSQDLGNLETSVGSLQDSVQSLTDGLASLQSLTNTVDTFSTTLQDHETRLAKLEEDFSSISNAAAIVESFDGTNYATRAWVEEWHNLHIPVVADVVAEITTNATYSAAIGLSSNEVVAIVQSELDARMINIGPVDTSAPALANAASAVSSQCPTCGAYPIVTLPGATTITATGKIIIMCPHGYSYQLVQ